METGAAEEKHSSKFALRLSSESLSDRFAGDPQVKTVATLKCALHRVESERGWIVLAMHHGFSKQDIWVLLKRCAGHSWVFSFWNGCHPAIYILLLSEEKDSRH